MIDQIEQAILNRLRAHWQAHGGPVEMNVFDIGTDIKDVLKTPCVSIATERVGIRKIVSGTYELKPYIYLYICCKGVSGGKGRRLGVYPLVMGVLGILVGQELEEYDLEIDPLMPEGPAVEIEHETLQKMGFITFRVGFSTTFDIEQLDSDEVAMALISEGLSYHLRSDAITDAHDEITYT